MFKFLTDWYYRDRCRGCGKAKGTCCYDCPTFNDYIDGLNREIAGRAQRYRELALQDRHSP